MSSKKTDRGLIICLCGDEKLVCLCLCLCLCVGACVRACMCVWMGRVALRCKGQLMELRESYDAANEQVSQLQVDKRQLKAEVDNTKGLMDEMRKQLNEKKEAVDTLHTELELRREELK